jgi:hypothetical protein
MTVFPFPLLLESELPPVEPITEFALHIVDKTLCFRILEESELHWFGYILNITLEDLMRRIQAHCRNTPKGTTDKRSAIVKGEEVRARWAVCP